MYPMIYIKVKLKMPLCLYFNNNKESSFIEQLQCSSFCSYFKTDLYLRGSLRIWCYFMHFVDPELGFKEANYLLKVTQHNRTGA